LKAAILANVEVSVNDALAKSKTLRHLVSEGTVSIFGAYYELQSGRVTFSQPIAATTGAHVAPSETRR
jgi:hypothetical protein